MKIDIKFEPRDIWIGLFWDSKWAATLEHGAEINCNDKASVELISGKATSVKQFDIYVCLLPCLPIHARWSIKQKSLS